MPREPFSSNRDLDAAAEAAAAHVKAQRAGDDASSALRENRDLRDRQAGLESKVDILTDDVRTLSGRIGRPPHANGPEDEGDGMYALCCEIARAQKTTRRAHVVAGGSVGATVVAIVVAVMQQLSAGRVAEAHAAEVRAAAEGRAAGPPAPAIVAPAPAQR